MSESKPIQQPAPGLADIYEKPVARILDFYISGDIKEAKEYTAWNQLMRNATENDAVVIHINSNGGDIFSAIQLMRTMAETPATVIASVEGMCMSAATLIFLCADVCEVSEHSHFMFHTYSSGNWGKGNEQIASALANDKWARHLFNSVYKGFLEIKEIKEMIDGKDFWMDPTEVKERLDKRNKHAKKTGKGMAKKAIERKKGRK
jgi:ATP-dependent protease ClpP protease subunit